MKKGIKTTLYGLLGLFTLGVLSSCNSFCSISDTSHFRYAYDPINTTFYTSKEVGFDQITENFIEATGIDQSLFTVEDLVFAYDDNQSIQYGDNSELFLNTLFTEINSNLVCLNPGQLRWSYYVEGSTTETSYAFYVGLSDFTVSLISGSSTNTNYIMYPSYQFYKELDKKSLEVMIEQANRDLTVIDSRIESDLSNLTFENLYGYSEEDLLLYRNWEGNSEQKDALEDRLLQEREENSILANYGYLKHYKVVTNDEGNEEVDYFGNILDWNEEIAETIGQDKVMTNNFMTLYQNNLNTNVANVQTCITVEDGFYGNLTDDPLNATVLIEGKASDFWSDWGRAFTEHGFLEGLFVYPIAVGVENMAHAFGMNGWGQIGAVLLMTLIVRALFMLITLPSTISQQKMTLIQPEMAKLQQKYPNADTNQYDKQRLAQAQVALYKKYKIHPFSSMLVMIIQLPLFISVWNAFRGSASLSSDAVLGLRLSDSIWNVLSNFTNWPNNPGWWTALVLIILMSAAQIISILIPNIINKRRNKKVAKMVKSESADRQAKTMKYVQWGMTAMIVIMGFTLPAAMGVYWFAGAIFSIIQTLVIQLVFIKKGEKKR